MDGRVAGRYTAGIVSLFVTGPKTGGLTPLLFEELLCSSTSCLHEHCLSSNTLGVQSAAGPETQ